MALRGLISTAITLTCVWALGCGGAQQAADTPESPAEPTIEVESLQEVAARLEESGDYIVEPRQGEVGGVAAGEGLVGALWVKERNKPRPIEVTVYSYEPGPSGRRTRSMSPKRRGGVVSNILAREDVIQVARCGRELYFSTERNVHAANRIDQAVTVASDNARACRPSFVME